MRPVNAGGSRRETLLGLRRSEWTMAVASIALNGVLNAVQATRLLLPVSFAACAAASGLAMRFGAEAADQGLAPRDVRRGILYGVAFSVPVVASAAAGLFLRPTRRLYAGGRAATTGSAGAAAYELLLRIPLGTALPEEVMFRGALLGVLSRHRGRVAAVVISSLIFGLWHVVPALKRIETTPALAGRSRTQKTAWVAATVCVTSASGILFAFLRYRSGSIAAPWIVHTTANVTGLAGGWLAGEKEAP